MKYTPESIFAEYREGVDFKASLGKRGMYEQNRINERFYVGDQWYGAKCGNERPLVRHNVIRRIGDFKMSQVVSAPVSVIFSADGVPDTLLAGGTARENKRRISRDAGFKYTGELKNDEINTVVSALSDYRNVTAERVGFSALCAKALKNAYITGSAVLYTYWNPDIKTGLYADDTDDTPVNGDISCEVLGIENVYFADPYLDDVQSQPYIIISSCKNADSVKREAKAYGAGADTLSLIGEGDENGKVLVLTKLYKEYKDNGECNVKCIKVTEKAVVRAEFYTELRMYPIALLRWEERNNLIYGESEITYLIPNQIAINRMITANVWSAMTMGMPLMVVNGDTVTDDITNDPGQIIKVFGSNEDVSGAIKYVVPPDSCRDFGSSINNLIENTLTQSGANEAALGDSNPDNASALVMLRDAATMPMQLIKNRFYDFIEQVSRIWADFWITKYGNRRIKISDENGVWYLPFDSSRYSGLHLTVGVDVGPDTAYSTAESINILTTLYDKGIITKKQYLKRLPKGSVPDISGLLSECEELENDSV